MKTFVKHEAVLDLANKNLIRITKRTIIKLSLVKTRDRVKRTLKHSCHAFRKYQMTFTRARYVTKKKRVNDTRDVISTVIRMS